MNLRKATVVGKRVLKQIRHDRRTLAIIFLTPLIIMLIFGYSYGGKVTDVRTGMINHDQGFGNENLAEKIIGHLSTETLTLQNASGEVAAREAVRNGQAWALIIFPSNFTRDVIAFSLTNVSAHVRIVMDGSDPTVASGVIKAVNDAIAAAMGDMHREASILTDWEYVYGGEDVQFIDFIAPGIMCVTAMTITLLITIVSFVRERTSGTLDRMIASPITGGEIVIGYSLAFTLINFVQTSILLSIVTTIFGVHVVGNIGLAFLIVALFSLGFENLGILLSAAAKTEFQAAQFVPLLILPSMLLAGVFWPLEAIPSSIRPASSVIPLTYAASALRSVIVRGWGPEMIIGQLIVLSLFAVVTMCLSFILVKRRK